MIRKLIIFSLIISSFTSCNRVSKDDSHYIKINTDKGDIIIKLYNQTPKHRDNFLKLSNENFFNGQIFHRIINNFVVQGGDPSTIIAKPDSLYGNKDSGYLIDAEIIDSLIHKKGAVGMAREGDDINPEKKSSGSQFYLVKGKVYTNEQLDDLENKRDSKNKNNLYKKLLQEKISSLKNQKKVDTVSISLNVSIAIDSIWEKYPKYKFTEKQRKIYTTIGGIPHLDGNYTVFGEIVEGQNIVDELSSVNTDKNDRPLKDIKFNISVVK
ncbi:MAG: peptidylprolyl isomerase [Bacteroidales bacterium]|nr:peptidylprolyl isomerase [Bacteroidales bacterium]